jgi:DNA-binding CsgD family transcriptional regulator
VIDERDREPRFAVAETTEFAPFRGGGSLQEWIESWPQPVVLIGGDDKVKFSNSALRLMLGYQERARRRDDLRSFVADATIEMHLAGFRADPTGARHVRVRDHDGRYRVLLTCRVPVPAVLAPDEMLIIAHDVSGPVSDVDVAEPIRLPTSLSPREREVVELMLTGHRVKNIAEMLFLSEHTVRNHLRSVFAKTGVGSQSELIRVLRG